MLIDRDKPELITVRTKDGKTKAVKIDPEMNEVHAANIRIIADKENCLDIFRDVMTVLADKEQDGHSKTNERKFLKDKISRNSREKTIIKLNMVIKLRAINGIAYLRCLLRKIQIAKELFILEIEQGAEVFIPKELSQDHLPYSMRYYDPIVALIQEAVSE